MTRGNEGLKMQLDKLEGGNTATADSIRFLARAVEGSRTDAQDANTKLHAALVAIANSSEANTKAIEQLAAAIARLC